MQRGQIIQKKSLTNIVPAPAVRLYRCTHVCYRMHDVCTGMYIRMNAYTSMHVLYVQYAPHPMCAYMYEYTQFNPLRIPLQVNRITGARHDMAYSISKGCRTNLSEKSPACQSENVNDEAPRPPTNVAHRKSTKHRRVREKNRLS